MHEYKQETKTDVLKNVYYMNSVEEVSSLFRYLIAVW